MLARPRLVVALAQLRPLDEVAALLPPAEQARAATSPRPDRRATAWALLRLLLTPPGTGDPAVAVVTRCCPVCGSAEHGRPATPSRYVSLATTRGLVAAAVATRPVGVDVERNDATGFPGFDDVALAPGESGADRPRAWSRKEALLKAAGTGLARDPRAVRLTADGRVLRGPRGVLLDVPAPAGATCSAAVLGRRRPVLRVVDGDALLSAAAAAARGGPTSRGAGPRAPAPPGRAGRRW